MPFPKVKSHELPTASSTLPPPQRRLSLVTSTKPSLALTCKF